MWVGEGAVLVVHSQKDKEDALWVQGGGSLGNRVAFFWKGTQEAECAVLGGVVAQGGFGLSLLALSPSSIPS